MDIERQYLLANVDSFLRLDRYCSDEFTIITSGYARESIVLRGKLVPYSRSLELMAEFVPQGDPKR